MEAFAQSMGFFTQYIGLTLLYLYQIFGDNLGLAIIAFTIVLRTLLLPLTIPSLRAANRMKQVQPELTKIKKKHKGDNKKIQEEQMKLYKKYNVNPLAGCLPQLIQLGILIVLYRVLIFLLNNPVVNNVTIDTTFLWMDLSMPDPTYVLAIVAAGSQLVLSFMIAPGAEKRDLVPNKSKKKKVQKENKKEEDFSEMAASMQQQMLFIMPLMTGILAARFPSGLALYWVVTTVFSIGQQYYVSGWGGLVIYYGRLREKISKLSGR